MLLIVEQKGKHIQSTARDFFGYRRAGRLGDRESLFFLFFLLLLSSAGYAQEASLTSVTLQLRWHHQFQFAGYYAAQQQGFFKDAGFDVTIRAGAPGREPVGEVLAGRAQFGVGNSEVLFQRLLNKPLIALAAIYQHSPSVLLVRQDSGIRTAQDLIGRKIMTVGIEDDADLMAMFRNEGIDPKQINFIKSSYQIADLIEGRTDAFNAYMTNEPYYMQKNAVPFNIISPTTYGVDFYSDILFTTESVNQHNPDGVRRFREAALKGWSYALQYPEEIIKLIQNEYGSDKSIEHLRFEAEAIRPLIMAHIVEIGHMNPGRWAHMADVFAREGMIDPNYSLEGFIYDPNPASNYLQWRRTAFILMAVIAIIAITSLILFRFNRKMRHEIDCRRQTERELERQKALFEAIFNGTPDATLFCNNERKILMCNPAFTDIFGYSPEEIIGSTTAQLYQNKQHFIDQGELRYNSNTPTELKIPPYEISYQRRNGEIFPSETQGGWVINNEGLVLGYVVVIRDIGPLKEAQKEIEKLALTDALTGIANRHQFENRLQESLKLAQRTSASVALIMIDLDKFKPVNDTFGHPVGDALLRYVATLLSEQFRTTDTVARIGGDEFAVVVFAPEPSDTIMPVARFLDQLSRPITLKGHHLDVTASAGIALYPADSLSATELIKMADAALYQAKHNGRNRYVQHGKPAGIKAAPAAFKATRN